jgi:acetate kinase
MNVLAVNCGSSSIKWGLFAAGVDGERGAVTRRWAQGRIERVGSEATLHFEAAGVESIDTTAQVPTTTTAAVSQSGSRRRGWVEAWGAGSSTAARASGLRPCSMTRW